MNLSLNEFINNYLPNSYDENMFNKDGSINPKYNSFKKTGLIAQIFDEHWEELYSNNKAIIDKMMPNADTDIRKVIDCANKDLGCCAYECTNCKDIIFIGYTCKSKACSSCGYTNKMNKVENILKTAYNCKHRQIVYNTKGIKEIFFLSF